MILWFWEMSRRSNSVTRSMLALAAFASILVGSESSGQDLAFKPGTWVIPKDQSVRLITSRNSRKPVVDVESDQPILRIYKIDKTDELWLRVVAGNSGTEAVSGGFIGWIKAAEVVPLDQAIGHLDAIIRRQPENAWAYAMRGAVRAELHDYRDAIKDLNQAIKLNSKDFISLYNRATCLYFTGEIDLSLKDLNDSININNKYALSYNFRGFIYFSLHKYNDALNNYNVSSKIDNKYVDPLVNSAIILAGCPDPAFRDGKKAVISATRACELLGWKNAYTVSTLAAAHAECGDFEKAAFYQSKAIALTPSNDELIDERRHLLTQFYKKRPYRLSN